MLRTVERYIFKKGGTKENKDFRGMSEFHRGAINNNKKVAHDPIKLYKDSHFSFSDSISILLSSLHSNMVSLIYRKEQRKALLQY